MRCQILIITHKHKSTQKQWEGIMADVVVEEVVDTENNTQA